MRSLQVMDYTKEVWWVIISPLGLGLGTEVNTKVKHPLPPRRPTVGKEALITRTHKKRKLMSCHFWLAYDEITPPQRDFRKSSKIITSNKKSQLLLASTGSKYILTQPEEKANWDFNPCSCNIPFYPAIHNHSQHRLFKHQTPQWISLILALGMLNIL